MNKTRMIPRGAAPRPFVLMNMAMTADGKIATANRVVSSFGSRRDQEHLYELRATADAVMAGARTAGRLRQEGKTYTVIDGDVLNIKFNL